MKVATINFAVYLCLASKRSEGWNANIIPSRREFVSLTAAVAASSASFPHPCIAATPATTAEAVRRSAANIPGYGQTDVFYPESFIGTWMMSREISRTSDDSSPKLGIQYPVRFLPSVEDNAVVADRGYNQAELEKALRISWSSKLKDEGASSSSEPAAIVRSYDWTETNPNVLRLAFADGSQKEIKVTKRATERTDSTVSSSEFQRVTQDTERGIPVITARRVLTKWKVIDDSTVEGIELVYDVGGVVDPLAGAAGGSSKPQLLSKSFLRMERSR